MAGLLIALAGVYLWIATAGTWRHFVRFTDDYSQMAAGFLHGQLNLVQTPPRELVALADPYDPKANFSYAMHDADLYNGKYYYYWGCVPGLCIAAVCWPLGISNPAIGDQYLGLLFTLGLMAVVTLLIFDVRAKLFCRQPVASAAVGVLSLGLGAPILFMVSRLAVYETAIAAGQFFLVAGIYAAWRGVSSGRPGAWALMTAGICWVLAVQSRVSLPPAVAALVVLTVWHLWRRGAARSAFLALAGPLFAGAILVGWYNRARFSSPFDIGVRYQLTGVNQHLLLKSGLLAWQNVLPALLSYLFTPPVWGNVFPYFFAWDGRAWLVRWIHVPANLRAEPLTGLLWTQALLILALIPLAMQGRGGMPEGEGSSSVKRWLIFSLAAGGVLGFAPVLTVYGSTMRYLVDLVPCCTVLAAIGYWEVGELLSSRRRAVVEFRTFVRLLVAAECAMGLLVTLSDDPALLAVARGLLGLHKIGG